MNFLVDILSMSMSCLSVNCLLMNCLVDVQYCPCQWVVCQWIVPIDELLLSMNCLLMNCLLMNCMLMNCLSMNWLVNELSLSIKHPCRWIVRRRIVSQQFSCWIVISPSHKNSTALPTRPKMIFFRTNLRRFEQLSVADYSPSRDEKARARVII